MQNSTEPAVELDEKYIRAPQAVCVRYSCWSSLFGGQQRNEHFVEKYIYILTKIEFIFQYLRIPCSILGHHAISQDIIQYLRISISLDINILGYHFLRISISYDIIILRYRLNIVINIL